MYQHPVLTGVNVAANILLSISLIHLILKVFGNADSKIHDYPLAAFLCKFASTVTFCGAVANVLTLSTPNWTEVWLNVGVSCNFLWLSFYDRLTSPSNSKVSRALPKRHSTKRARPPKSSKARPASSRNGRRGPSSR